MKVQLRVSSACALRGRGARCPLTSRAPDTYLCWWSLSALFAPARGFCLHLPRLLCGIPCRGFSAAHALIKNSQPRPSGGAAQGPRPWCRRAGRPNDRSSDFKTPARVEVRGGTCRNPARQVHTLNACHRLTTVDGPTKSKPHASLMRMMMINEKSNAPPTDLVMMMMMGEGRYAL